MATQTPTHTDGIDATNMREHSYRGLAGGSHTHIHVACSLHVCTYHLLPRRCRLQGCASCLSLSDCTRNALPAQTGNVPWWRGVNLLHAVLMRECISFTPFHLHPKFGATIESWCLSYIRPVYSKLRPQTLNPVGARIIKELPTHHPPSGQMHVTCVFFFALPGFALFCKGGHRHTSKRMP